MAGEFEAWVNKNHPEIKTEIEIDGAQTILIGDDDEPIDEDFWEDFCND